MPVENWACKDCAGQEFDYEVCGEVCPRCNSAERTVPSREYYSERY